MDIESILNQLMHPSHKYLPRIYFLILPLDKRREKVEINKADPQYKYPIPLRK